MSRLLVLYEHSAGFAMFRVKEFEELATFLPQVEEAVTDLQKFNSVVTLIAFQPFKSAQLALENINAISEGILPEDLSLFLEDALPEHKRRSKCTLGVSDPQLGAAICEALEIPCSHSGVVPEVIRGIRHHFHVLIKGLTLKACRVTQLGLSHSYSRARVKFNAHRVDNKIVQSTALLDQLDKDTNTLSLRIRQPDPSHRAHAAQTLVAPMSTTLAAANENKANEESDTIWESKQVLEIVSGELGNQTSENNNCKTTTNFNRLTNCVVKLYDISKKPKEGVQDEPSAKTRKANSFNDSQNTASEDKIFYPKASWSKSMAQVTNKVEVDKHKVSKICSTDLSKNSTKKQFKDLSGNCSEKVLFVCDVCCSTFDRKHILIKHLKSHSIVNLFFCALCKYKCSQKNNLVRHMRTHTGEKPYSCTLCKYKCAKKKDLVSHMRTHTGEKPYTCFECEFKCSLKYNLVRHMKTHTGEKPYSCTICKYKFLQKSDLVSHMRTHTGEKPYTCLECQFKCSQKNNLVRHMRTHTGEKPYSCTICKYKCLRKSDLVSHMRTHTGEKPYTCLECEFKCSQKNNLVRHMRTHTGEKPYSCTICKYKCLRKSDLVSHKRTHTGEKPYTCLECEFKCSQKNSLVRHMRTHTGEKPYSCTICKYKCLHKSDLVSHMRTHTGEKPYTCLECEYKCSEKSSLVRHMKTH